MYIERSLFQPVLTLESWFINLQTLRIYRLHQNGIKDFKKICPKKSTVLLEINCRRASGAHSALPPAVTPRATKTCSYN